MELIGIILSYVFIGSIIAFFVIRSKNKKGKIKNYKKDKMIILITMISSFILTGVCYSLSPQAKQDAIQEACEEKQEAKEEKRRKKTKILLKKVHHQVLSKFHQTHLQKVLLLNNQMH